MQMARYSVKLPYLSPYPESTVSNFTLFTLLFTFLFHFLSLHSPLLSFPSVPFYSLSCTPFWAALSLSALLFPPRSRLSLRSEQHVAMNSPPWQWAMNPQEQRRQQSLARRKQISFLRSYYTSCLWLWWHNGAGYLLYTCHKEEYSRHCHVKHTLELTLDTKQCAFIFCQFSSEVCVSSHHFCVVYKWVSVSLRGQAHHQVCRWFHYFVPAQSSWA